MTFPSFLALVAMMPAAFGIQVVPVMEEAVTARLCNGGSIEIPLGREPEDQRPCSVKACHAPTCRKRFDLAQ